MHIMPEHISGMVMDRIKERGGSFSFVDINRKLTISVKKNGDVTLESHSIPDEIPLGHCIINDHTVLTIEFYYDLIDHCLCDIQCQP